MNTDPNTITLEVSPAALENLSVSSALELQYAIDMALFGLECPEALQHRPDWQALADALRAVRDFFPAP